MIDLTITARNDGTAEDQGMTLVEIERACATLRRNGGTDDTHPWVQTSRVHRIRTISAEVDPDAGIDEIRGGEA